MASNDATVTVHVQVTLDGQPISHLLEAPASIEQMEQGKGLHIHLALDGHKLAEVLLPHISRVLREQTRPRGAQETHP